jgi:hypothetical protein
MRPIATATCVANAGFVELQLLAAVAYLALIAACVPWTRTAVTAWLVTIPLLVVPALLALAMPLRLEPILVAAVWGLVIYFPNRSPFGPLSRPEMECHEVVHRVSAGARAAYRANTLLEQRATFIADLETLDPPNDLWRLVKTAQILDLRADPPQVGVGDATKRLASWPWRVALDHRIIPIRLRLDDAVRARRVRDQSYPGFDDMTTATRYDYYFLRTLAARFEDLRTREGGLSRWHDEAVALLSLGRAVDPPSAAWTKVRNLVLEILELELLSETTALGAAQLDRLAIAAKEAKQNWADLERQDARGMTSAS